MNKENVYAVQAVSKVQHVMANQATALVLMRVRMDVQNMGHASAQTSANMDVTMTAHAVV